MAEQPQSLEYFVADVVDLSPDAMDSVDTSLMRRFPMPGARGESSYTFFKVTDANSELGKLVEEHWKEILTGSTALVHARQIKDDYNLWERDSVTGPRDDLYLRRVHRGAVVQEFEDVTNKHTQQEGEGVLDQGIGRRHVKVATHAGDNYIIAKDGVPQVVLFVRDAGTADALEKTRSATLWFN